MTAIVEVDLPVATDGEIAAINLESARVRAWARFGEWCETRGIEQEHKDRTVSNRHRVSHENHLAFGIRATQPRIANYSMAE